MSTGARELRPMFSFNPSEPAILHDRITDNIETWTGEEEADYRENSVTLSDGQSLGLRVRRMGQRAGRLTKRCIVLFFFRNFAP
jgi:hypothetical protein